MSAKKRIENDDAPVRETKFNVSKSADKRTFDGIVFDSVMEMQYYRDVVLPLVESGSITKYELQKPYELQPGFKHNGKSVNPIIYVADFYIEYSDGHVEVIDTKGCPDAVAKLKRKMFWYTYPGTIYRWMCYSAIDGGWCDYEVVQRGRAKRRKEKAAKKAAEADNEKQKLKKKPKKG